MMNTEPPLADVTAERAIGELAAVEERFNRAMISNDLAQISACITDDWVLVTPESGIVTRSQLLEVVRTGELSHDTMTKQILRVRLYGNTAIVTARGQNTGRFQGRDIGADEWVTDVYRRVDDGWRCVLTHLTPVRA